MTHESTLLHYKRTHFVFAGFPFSTKRSMFGPIGLKGGITGSTAKEKYSQCHNLHKLFIWITITSHYITLQCGYARNIAEYLIQTAKMRKLTFLWILWH